MTFEGECYILGRDEEPPDCKVGHKSHIVKIQFICAIARPWYDYHRNKLFDGKIGIWPVGEYRPALRNSCNSPAGTPVWHNININKEKYRELMIELILSAIKDKFPPTGHRPIRIQQDGATAHISPEDEEFCLTAAEPGMNVELFNQPPNSPDTNLCDLGFFRAIQSFSDACPETETELIAAVTKAYNEYPHGRINKVWLTYISCLNRIIEHNGDNDYKIPHIGKDRLERLGQLPTVLPFTPAANKWLTDDERVIVPVNRVQEAHQQLVQEATEAGLI